MIRRFWIPSPNHFFQIGREVIRRKRRARWIFLFALAALFACGASSLKAQQVPPELYSKLHWRLIGPFRGGRITCVTGIPGNAAVYYAGTPGGGIFKTTDSGQVWTPIFDATQVASIGAIAVAPTNASIIYVGTGEQTPGNGMWKSTDAGATWKHIGLEKTHFISTVLVDPQNPNIVLVAALGDRASGDERGVFQSTDGGATWKKVLYRDETFGVIDMSFDPRAPKIVFASFQRRAAPPGGGGRGRGGAAEAPPEHDIYKSTDGGATWQQLETTGLPVHDLGRIGIVIAPGSGGRRVYAIINQGFFRSDDSGATWTQPTKDPRIVSSGYFGKVFVNPTNQDDVFIGQTTMYRSKDGGRTWVAFTGAPSGDDYHTIWINPENPRYMIQGVDQGAVVSENGGETWSTWNNQPTGQLYHVSTDNQYPYIVYAAQQDSGTVAIPSRSNFGAISDTERFSVAGFEAAYITPDPLNPNLIYSNSWYGSVVRFDRTTGQIVTVFVPPNKYRVATMAPLVFSPQDPHTLYLGAQYVLKTTDGGMSWQEISPDVTAMPAPPPAPDGGAGRGGRGGGRGGVINTLAVSAVRGGVMWTGSSNGRIQMTQDGGANWKDVTSPDFPSITAPNGVAISGSVGIIDASHFDASTAYAAISSAPTADPAPHIFRTHDGGATWQKIVTGLPPDTFVRFVREDSVRKGLLFAGTETSMWVSFDDGGHWQSLQLNLPVTSMRDLVVKGDDLVLATYGRSIYILDDISLLRQDDLGRIASKASGSAGEVELFHPANAVRTRWDVYQDTPLQRETAMGDNPPDGAIFDYYLKSAPPGEITLDILDAKGNLVRHYSSNAMPHNDLLPNVPEYWFAPDSVLSKTPGPQRFVWDLHYENPRVLPYSYYGNILDYVEYTLADHAIPGQTPRVQPQGPIAAPGNYTAVLTANGRTSRQSFTVTADPRVHASQADLEEQLALAQKTIRGLAVSADAYQQAATLRAAIDARLATAGLSPEIADALKKAAKDAVEVQEGVPANPGPARPGVGPVNRDLARVYWMIESGDSRPSKTAKASVQELCDALDKGFDAWRVLNAQTIPALNAQLAAQKLAPLPIIGNIATGSACGK
jgi:photosystem II stability/assembly factor-like uncharacterized protein